MALDFRTPHQDKRVVFQVRFLSWGPVTELQSAVTTAEPARLLKTGCWQKSTLTATTNTPLSQMRTAHARAPRVSLHWGSWHMVGTRECRQECEMMLENKPYRLSWFKATFVCCLTLWLIFGQTWSNQSCFSDVLQSNETRHYLSWSLSLEPCFATSHKGYRKFAATVSLGEPAILQAPDSDVCLQIPEGAPGIYLSQVHTEFSNFTELLLDLEATECVVSPIVELKFSPLNDQLGETHPRKSCQLNIPHCMENRAEWKDTRVTHYHKDNNEPVVNYMKQDSSDMPARDTFRVTQNMIHITTDKFCKIVCTKCGEILCATKILAFLFGHLNKSRAQGNTMVNFRVILGSNLNSMIPFKNVSTQGWPLRTPCLLLTQTRIPKWPEWFDSLMLFLTIFHFPQALIEEQKKENFFLIDNDTVIFPRGNDHQAMVTMKLTPAAADWKPRDPKNDKFWTKDGFLKVGEFLSMTNEHRPPYAVLAMKMSMVHNRTSMCDMRLSFTA